MLKIFRRLFIVLVATQLLAGCTTQAWYYGMQNAAKQTCLRQPASEQERCDARLNKQDYDTYEKNRTGR